MASNTKPMAAFFTEDLNAPLKNTQWSWGAENKKGVYLRIWDIEVKNKLGLVYENDLSDTRLGQKERFRHIKAIQQGKPGYVVVISKGHENANGRWKIDEYKECVYALTCFEVNDGGDIYAKIDFSLPIYPSTIGNEIDTDSIITATEKNQIAEIKLHKAMNKFGWTPTQIDPSMDIISLISQDGKKSAKLVISTAEWVR